MSPISISVRRLSWWLLLVIAVGILEGCAANIEDDVRAGGPMRSSDAQRNPQKRTAQVAKLPRSLALGEQGGGGGFSPHEACRGIDSEWYISSSKGEIIEFEGGFSSVGLSVTQCRGTPDLQAQVELLTPDGTVIELKRSEVTYEGYPVWAYWMPDEHTMNEVESGTYALHVTSRERLHIGLIEVVVISVPQIRLISLVSRNEQELFDPGAGIQLEGRNFKVDLPLQVGLYGPAQDFGYPLAKAWPILVDQSGMFVLTLPTEEMQDGWYMVGTCSRGLCINDRASHGSTTLWFRVSADSPMGEPPNPDSLQIEPGEVLSGEILEHYQSGTYPSGEYWFDGRAGQRVTIVMEVTAGPLDPSLELYGPDYIYLTKNDDGGGGPQRQNRSV